MLTIRPPRPAGRPTYMWVPACCGRGYRAFSGTGRRMTLNFDTLQWISVKGRINGSDDVGPRWQVHRAVIGSVRSVNGMEQSAAVTMPLWQFRLGYKRHRLYTRWACLKLYLSLTVVSCGIVWSCQGRTILLPQYVTVGIEGLPVIR